MSRFTATLATLMFVLAACAAPTSPAPTVTPLPAPTNTPSPTATTAEAGASQAPAATETGSATGGTGGAVTYVIDPAQSEASFQIGEELFGQPVTVKGVTNKVSGSFTADYANPANSTVSTIEIEADFVTDESRRNNAIRRFILQTDQFPKITFAPTRLESLPAQVKPGEQIRFKIVGNLTIRDVTREVTFDATVTLPPDNTAPLRGEATAVVRYPDFNLTIPSVPFVANVTEAVTLTLTFVAKPA